MARTPRTRNISVKTLRHEEEKRRNIPTAEYQSVLQREAESPVRVAYERRNRGVLDTPGAEIEAVGRWLADRMAEGVLPHEIGVFVRSRADLDRAMAAIGEAGPPVLVLDGKLETTTGHVSASTMHLAKGLEFRAVVVMACDDEIIPQQERSEAVADETDLEEVYDTERHLLYVACTRARDHLLVTGVEPGSEFLDDLQA
jgi:ATP-dependent exoDNAse (exonuclease V) beta subunit